jgi:hypothetical protein
MTEGAGNGFREKSIIYMGFTHFQDDFLRPGQWLPSLTFN